MHETVRFGDYLQEVGVRHERVSYNDVVAASEPGARLRPDLPDVFRILRPYVSPRFMEQFRAVAPLALYLVAFQLLCLRQSVEGGTALVGALLAVVVGLMLFMEGLRLGLMPLGGRLGETLPTHQPLPVVLGVVFLLGIGVTFAEPAIGALQAAGAVVSPDAYPHPAPGLPHSSTTAPVQPLETAPLAPGASALAPSRTPVPPSLRVQEGV